MNEIDRINNLRLIETSLRHIKFEISENKPNYFYIAREAHSLLYRTMIEALKGSANIPVTGKRLSNRPCKYHIGNEGWKEIHKVLVDGCIKAWRFSQPVLCDPPPIDFKKDIQNTNNDDFLIDFYDALAMIQTECYMRKFTFSKTIEVSDEEMQNLEWLHKEIRNKYEHFIPMMYIATINELLESAKLCLKLGWKVIFESENVIFHDISGDEMQLIFSDVVERLNQKNT